VSDETRGKPGVVATSLSGCLFRLISTANGDGKATVNNTCAKAMERGSFKETPWLVFTAFGDVVNREVEAWLRDAEVSVLLDGTPVFATLPNDV
jgi:hypothetical protein